MSEIGLPIIVINKSNCSDAWIEGVKQVWRKGILTYNHYEDKPSKEVTAIFNISNPNSQPRINKLDSIFINKKKRKDYVDEVLKGTRDKDVDDPKRDRKSVV